MGREYVHAIAQLIYGIRELERLGRRLAVTSGPETTDFSMQSSSPIL
jgi:hypothetical protein